MSCLKLKVGYKKPKHDYYESFKSSDIILLVCWRQGLIDSYEVLSRCRKKARFDCESIMLKSKETSDYIITAQCNIFGISCLL